MNEVQVKINDKKGSFFIEIEGKQEAEMTFVFAGEDKIIIDHTGVNPGNEGKGLGKQMVAQAVTYARENNIKNHSALSVCQKSIRQNSRI